MLQHVACWIGLVIIININYIILLIYINKILDYITFLFQGGQEGVSTSGCLEE